jgi:hypothetical protein
VIAVAEEDQQRGNDMMGKHLPMVLPPLFNVKDHDLLQPKGVLHQSVPFEQSLSLSVWKVGPEILEIEPVVGIN